ncbi:HBL/NHE enterotoxin family protein [Pseudomonas sp. HMWF006]|uniref:HBL/NHE enterotoxin family protein n=1 Tax=Pseudomonas sp. HMWF006 TaxID=2056843 RepID=UPI000D41F699|nr:HBL/NHE enterotoxin family protein [Pseudomonas sp. HMWF006]PTS99757.1 hypothetical protein DBR24_12170 [Pseudomonas sp. HMWF006]PTT64335.1 hypothetical protein DBR26_21240 [Pseudomonas sp. HMWF007]PTT78736.1 hypothetical protein DBR29_32330 [Pseudomonas sp. HMWF005]
MTLMQRIDVSTVSMFRSAEINAGTMVVLSVTSLLDTLSSKITQLPNVGSNSIPQLNQHISTLKLLANEWPTANKPSLLAAMQQLKEFGDSFISTDAPTLQKAFQSMSDNNPGAQQAAANLTNQIIQKLSGPSQTVNVVTHSIGEYLSQLANVSSDINGDSAIVAQRIQNDQARSAMLETQANDLQSKLDDARSRAKWYWLMGPLAALLAQEIDSLASNLGGVINQLNEIRSDQANTLAEENYLQALLPALNAYLTGVNQMGAGINSILAGIQALQSQLGQLTGAIESSPGAGTFANAQLQAALIDWRDISEKLSQLT